jgi:SAM-dependent methyltransferase
MAGEPTAWDEHAGWWQENFTDGADPEYEEQILPLAAAHLSGCARVVDVGCGEGQLSRLSARLGAGAVGVDPTWSQVALAVERGGGPVYCRGSAEHLPLPSASFDAAVVCLVLEHLDPFEPALDEIARVLRPGGRFLLFLNHPILQAPDSGWIDDDILGEQYWRIGPYLIEDVGTEEVSPGVVLPFVHRPLSRYVNALLERGLSLVRMEEPAPPPGFLERAPEYREAASFPRLLFLLTRKEP